VNQVKTTESLARLLTIEEAARVAGVSRQAVYRWIERRLLHAQLTDDGYRVSDRALARFLAERQAAANLGVRVDILRRWRAGLDATE